VTDKKQPFENIAVDMKIPPKFNIELPLDHCGFSPCVFQSPFTGGCQKNRGSKIAGTIFIILK
jgi:hypothetical protein